MEETTNYSIIRKIFKRNGGYITRKDINDAGISSWFLSDFVKRNNLLKIAPGFYASGECFIDYYFVLQRRYPKYVYSGITSLYLHHLTDKIPVDIEVVAPQGYNPSRKKTERLSIRRVSNKDIYNLGITEITTVLGNKVRVYDEERTICDLIKYRDKYDGETFIKALKLYSRKVNNQVKLFRYARTMGIEKKVFEIMEVLNNEN